MVVIRCRETSTKKRPYELFINDLDFYRKNYRIIDLSELIAAIEQPALMPKNALFLSFDDGFSEISDVIAPVLYDKGVPCSFFLNNDFLDNKQLFFGNKVSLILEHLVNEPELETQVVMLLRSRHKFFDDISTSLKRIKYLDRAILDDVAGVVGLDFQQFLNEEKPYLSTEQVNSLLVKGFTIGAHSLDHPKYNELTLGEQIRQTQQSMDELTTRFNLGYRAFCLPFTERGVERKFFDFMEKNAVYQVALGTRGIYNRRNTNLVQRFSPEGKHSRHPIETMIKTRLVSG